MSILKIKNVTEPQSRSQKHKGVYMHNENVDLRRNYQQYNNLL